MRIQYCESCGKRTTENDFPMDELPIPGEQICCIDCRAGYGISTTELLPIESGEMDTVTETMCKLDPDLKRRLQRKRLLKSGKALTGRKKPRRPRRVRKVYRR